MARPGDEIYFQVGNGPTSGRVVCHGRHGVTVHAADGAMHRIKWDRVLGYKVRTTPTMRVVETGADGAILSDEAGRRAYVHGYKEEETPMKPAEPTGWDRLGKALILFAKAIPIKNRPGLHVEDRTDRTGRHQKKWVRGQEAAKSPRQKKPPEANTPTAKVGQQVAFEAAGKTGEGQVVAAGKDGATVQDEAGKEHPVYWREIQSGPAKPDWAPRNAGESDKEYAKRVVDKGEAPSRLPEEHERYFDTAGATKVPLENLHSTKSDEDNQKGGDNGPKRMLAAYHGALGKRSPITVMPHKDREGHYEVVDGNGTLTSAKKLGWQHLPTKVVSREEGEFLLAEDKAREIAKAILPPTRYTDLPRKARQPDQDRAAVFKRGTEALDHLKTWLNRGQGVASRMGYQTMAKSPEEVGKEEWEKPGGMLFIAPLKGEKRAAEKVEADYGGDWSQLSDVVRCTIAVDNLNDMSDAIETLTKQGMKPAQIPKNKFLKPSPQGYMDMNYIIEMPNGCLAEVQFNVKDMLLAKNDAHPHYEITRSIEARYADPNTGEVGPKASWSEADRKTHAKAEAEQVRIYGTAWRKHVRKHYGHAQKMVKSLRILFTKGTQ